MVLLAVASELVSLAPLLLVIGAVVAFIILLPYSRRAEAANRKVTDAKFNELLEALRAAWGKIIDKKVNSAEVIDKLIDAGSHLNAPSGWTSTRRIITASDWVANYQRGIELVKEAEKQAGV